MSATCVTLGLGLAVASGLALSSSTGCNRCEQHGFCIDWLRIGDTYRIELVQHLGPEFFNQAGMPILFGRTPDVPHTCGAGFDLRVGDTMSLRAEQRTKSGRDECVECYYAWARPEVEGVKFANDSRYADSIGTPEFVTGRTATIGDCSGNYEIGVTPVYASYRQSSNLLPATDYVLFRAFFTGDLINCTVDGSELREGKGGCWDAWAVRIRDASGKLLTKDIATSAPSDAGGARADEDAGR